MDKKLAEFMNNRSLVVGGTVAAVAVAVATFAMAAQRSRKRAKGVEEVAPVVAPPNAATATTAKDKDEELREHQQQHQDESDAVPVPVVAVAESLYSSRTTEAVLPPSLAQTASSPPPPPQALPQQEAPCDTYDPSEFMNVSTAVSTMSAGDLTPKTGLSPQKEHPGGVNSSFELESHRRTAASSSTSIIAVSVPATPSLAPVAAPYSLHDSPPPSILPPLKLFDEVTELASARTQLTEEPLLRCSSSTSSLNSSGDDATSPPRENGLSPQKKSSAEERSEEQRRKDRWSKILAVDALLHKVALCLEREKRRVVAAAPPEGHSEATDAHVNAWLQDLRTTEASTSSISLRKLIGAEKSRHIVLALQRWSQLGDWSELTALHPFAKFLFVKELIEQNDLSLLTTHLLFQCLADIVEHNAQHQVGPVTSIVVQNLPLCTVLQPERLFFEATAFVVAGQLLEHETIEIAIDMLPGCLLRPSGSQQSPFVNAYVHALEATNGNDATAWHMLALAMDDGNPPSVLGRLIASPLVALEECLRCSGGALYCTQLSVWTDAAALLEYAALAGRQQSNNNATVAVLRVPNTAHLGFLAAPDSSLTAGAAQVPFTAVDRRHCLARALALPEGALDPQLWVQLALLLHIGMSTECDPMTGRDRQIMREEKCSVGDMSVTKFDCFSFALALNPSDAEAWYRAALCMEDRIRLDLEIAAGQRGPVHPHVYQRNLLGPSAPSVDRVTALFYALSFAPDDPKVWFALATTLFERNRQLIQPSELQAGVPRGLFSLPSMAQAVDNVVSASADVCFEQCIALRPQMSSVVDRWIAQQQQRAH